MDNKNTPPLRLPKELKKKLDEALSGLCEDERKEFEEALELWIIYGGS